MMMINSHDCDMNQFMNQIMHYIISKSPTKWKHIKGEPLLFQKNDA
jgi:hypothetical protein